MNLEKLHTVQHRKTTHGKCEQDRGEVETEERELATQVSSESPKRRNRKEAMEQR